MNKSLLLVFVANLLFAQTKGGQEMFGQYEIVKGWPKDISTLPGNEKWTYGAGQAVYAESPNRIIMLFRGELPNIKRPQSKMLTEFGPSIQFPIGRLPWRDATTASLPGGGASGSIPGAPTDGWSGTLGVDAKWENCIVIADANGNIVERWTQWDKILQRPHFVAINPYDPEKHVWIVDDHMGVIYKFSHDGKQLVQTIGTPKVTGADGTHFNRPTFLAWLPDSTMFVADGYNGTRVAKFDKNGKFLLDWGRKLPRQTPYEQCPRYRRRSANTPRVRERSRKQAHSSLRRERQVSLRLQHGRRPVRHPPLYIGADRTLWAADRGTSKMLKYDLDGNFLYSWGIWGDFPGGFWGVHGFSVDQEGNFYTAEVDSGRVQKFRPKAGRESGAVSQQAGVFSVEVKKPGAHCPASHSLRSRT